MKLKIFSAALLICLIITASSVVADDVYDSVPTFSPYYAGKIKSSVLNEALEELNYIRGLIGVPNNVTLNDDYTNKAQHGAVLLDAIDTLTHTPNKPSDMSESFYELGYAGTSNGNAFLAGGWIQNGVKIPDISLSKSTKSYMDDSDASNIARLGHRRWLMNPRMKQTGFGMSTRRGYEVTYVIEEYPENYDEFQTWLKWPISDEFITWPTCKNPHPLAYFASETAWCVVLNNEIFDTTSASSVNVTLTRLSDNKTWNFSSSYSDGDFYVAENNVAYDECIIFRPNNISSYNNGEQWRVNVSGLTRKNGGSGNLSYTVNFTSSSTGYEDNSNYNNYNNNNNSQNYTQVRKKDDDSFGCNTGLNLGFFALIIFGIPRVKKFTCWK